MKQRRWPSIVVCYFLGLIFMAFLTFLPEQSGQETREQNAKSKRKRPKQKPSSSWEQFKSLLSCKQMEATKVQDPSKNTGPYSIGSSCSAICSFKDVVHGNTRGVHRANNSPNSSSVSQEARLLIRRGEYRQSTQYGRGMQLRRLSGCYECRMFVDPSRCPVSRNTICACPQCGEVFPKIESLELHQIIRHAVSELGSEDAGLNIVEIIFKSSWMKKDVCKIERILKVHNTQRTIQRFEECRDTVKTRALNSTRKNPRCAADGNELLRFHCATLSCALGTRGSTSLCGSIAGCGVCNIIRYGFQRKGENKGVRTMASSGRAHDALRGGHGNGGRAMLVCRVIAGKVKRMADDAPAEEDSMSSGFRSYDAVAGSPGLYSNQEDLIVYNPRAILPCFVVIYKAKHV